MKRLSFMVSMAMLISCVASCDSGSDAVSYGVGTLSLGLSANPSFSSALYKPLNALGWLKNAELAER